MTSKQLFTSGNQEWETPPEFFDRLNRVYKFTLDACATKENAKVERFFSVEDNGLSQSWKNERVWLNPPYGRKANGTPGQYAWVKKAYNEVRTNDCEMVVCLLPARTDTKLFHELVMDSAMVAFIKGRLQFVSASAGAVFPSMLVVFDRSTYKLWPVGNNPVVCTMDAK